MSHSIERNVQAFLTAEREVQVRFLAEIVRIPTDNPPGDCSPAAERAAKLIEAFGWTVERHPVPADVVEAAGMISCTNLIVRRTFGPGPTIALNAHGDVVPPGTGWTHDPYGAEIKDGWMYGRGAAVSKSDFATYVWALRALEASGARLGGTVELHLTYDEETGGEIGPGYLLAQGLSKPDLAIGAGFSYAVVTAHNGCLHLEVEVTGRSAHAAKPWTGIDALQAATSILSALYAWRPSLETRTSKTPGIGAPQLTIGLVSGGINTNVVPDRVVFRLDRRIVPEENIETVEAELREIIGKAVQSVDGARVDVRRILYAAPLQHLPAGDRMVEALCRRASEVMGEPIRPSGVPLYTDARHYSAHGVPVVLYGAGPRTIEEANAHRADERLPLSDLYKATEVIALTLADLLAV
ncbi:MAG TPA: M20/M25/M40 family metallo-hydrolase [Hyphomicrobiaceae bacterium]|nr:M20/M25/M40 family metallo-hydrolase [Hyphomicrobiaceae bacterium]